MSPLPGSIEAAALRRMRWRLTWMTLAALVALASFAGLYFVGERAEIRQKTGRDLEAILQIKISQIVNWRAERLTEASHAAEILQRSADLRTATERPDSPEGRAVVRALDRVLELSDHYLGAAIVDRAGTVRLTSTSTPADVSAAARRNVSNVWTTMRPQLLGLHKSGDKEPVHFDLLAPLTVTGAGGTPEVFAVLLLRLEAAHFLQPLSREWPLNSVTGELQLVERDGDEVAFLTAPRHRPEALALMRFPISADIGAARAARGERGLCETFDYRGHATLAALGAVPDSPWLVVTKMDREEAYAGVRSIAWQIAGLALCALCVCGFVTAYFWRQRREQLGLETSVELQRSNRLFSTLARANQAALNAQTREELSEMFCAALVEQAGMRLAWIGWENPRARQLEVAVAFGPAKGYADGLVISIDPADSTSRGPSGRAILLDLPQVVHDVESDPSMAPWLERQRQWGIRASASLPIRDADGTRGVLTFYSDEPHYFSEAIIALTLQMATDFSHALKVMSARRLLERQSVALRESETRYRALFEQNHAVVLLVEPGGGRIVDANPAACRFYGYDHAALCRLSVLELNTMPADELRRHMAERVTTGRSNVYHFHHRLADGSVRAVEVVSGPMQIDGRQVLYSIVHDETDRVRAERELRTSEARLSLALAAANQGIYDVNLKTGEATVSREYALMLGYEPEGFVENNDLWLARLHPDDRPAAEQHFRDYLAGRVPTYQLEFRLRTRDGGWKWINSHGRIVERDAAGQPLRIIGAHTDITERKRNELALQFNARRTQALLELPGLADGCDEHTFLQRGLAVTEELTGSRISFAHFVNPDQETIELAAWSKRTLEEYCHATHSKHYPLSEAGIWADAMRERRAVIFNDYASYPHKHGLPQGHSHLVRLITVPVLEMGKVVMMVGVGNSDVDYHEGDVETVRLLAESMWRTIWHRRSLAALRESEQRWQFALEGADEGVWDWNMQTDSVYFSARLQTMLGYQAGDFRPHISEWESRVHPDDSGTVRQVLSDYLEGRRPTYVVDHRLRCKDGSYRWIRDIGKVMERDANGRAIRMIGTHTDVTERRRAEQALRESELKLRHLFDNLEAGVVVHSQQTKILLANPRAGQILGLSLDQMMGREAPDPAWCFLQEDGSRMPVAGYPVSRVLSARTPIHNMVLGVQRKQADVAWVLVNGYPEFGADGQIDQVVIIFLDITERRRQEQQIHERETRWQEALLTAMDGYLQVDETGRILEVNPAYARMSGYSVDELLQLHVWELEADEDRAAVARRMEELRRVGSVRFRSRHRRKDGEIRHVEVSLTFSSRHGGRYSSFIRDVTEQQLAVERLRIQSAALESAANTIVITDVTGRIEWVNDAFTRTTGFSREEALGQNPRVLKSGRHPPEFYQQMWKTILSGQVWHGELHNVRKDGSPLDEEALITPVRAAGGAITHFVAIKQDITERKHLEQQLLRSQRMEGIGMLAGGIAHDLNNVLAPILLSVELLRLRFKDSADRRTLEVIEASARRGAGIVKQVLTFARGIEGERISLRPRDLIREIVMMIEETFPRDITIRREVPAETPLISGDVTQLHQILLNLAVNARDAMPDGGTLTFRVETLDLTAATSVHSGDLPPGHYLVIAVEDTGHGMAPEVKDRIFEPFFTTKSRGKGTGLGLPTVLGIVRSHGGAIDVRSEPGRGSEFRVFLPALAAEQGEAPAEPVESALAGGGRTVLVVDDEPAIREVAAIVLEQAGFTILEASNGREAVTVFTENRDRIDAVVTDIMMPLMTGDRAAAEMLEQKPGLPILFMSGLMEQDTVQAALRNVPGHKVTLLRKPFVASDLLHQLESVLAAAKG